MRRSIQNTRVFAAIALAIVGLWTASASAASPPIRAEAVAGKPLGVGRVEVTLPQGQIPEPLGLAGLGVTEKDGRVLYPVVDRRPLRGLLRDALDRPRTVTIYFLFRGVEPLHLSVQSQAEDSIVVTPVSRPSLHEKAMRVWWEEYAAPPRLLEVKPDGPALVESYLTAMLARRLDLPLPPAKDDSSEARLQRELRLLAQSEDLRIAMMRERLLGRGNPSETADQPLPEPIDPPPLETPEATADAAVEPIAMRVPAECYYIRFGAFSNYVWLQDTYSQWRGDLQNLIALRGLDYNTRQRMETQLALRQSVLARYLGDTVIADVALIGTDLFLKEGGAYGLLFQTRFTSNFLVNDVRRQWEERKQQDKTVTEEKLRIEDHDVAFLSSPDGRVRSFFASHGDFHFATTSKTLMRRFLEASSGKGALGATAEFRHARSLMPVSRNDTVFVYLSDAFFRNFTSPAYRIELVRRLEALSDLETTQLARLAAIAEGKPSATIENLVAGGFLPEGFGVRPDGTRTLLEGGEVRDSLRGRPGTFMPIPDVEVAKVSPSEAESYRQFADYYQAKWHRLDPIVAGVKRHDLSGSQQRVVIDARMTPLARRKYELLTKSIGEADAKRLAPIPDDAAAMELLVPGQRIFAGLRNFNRPMDLADRLLPYQLLYRVSEGYLGFMGQSDWLGWLEEQFRGPADPSGYSTGTGAASRYQDERMTVYSPQRSVLEQVVPQVALVEAERPAQFRLRVADVSRGPLSSQLNNLGYGRTLRTSLGNLSLLHAVSQQLRVPAEQARTTAEKLLGAALVCPLGGDYEYRSTEDGVGFWMTTVLDDGQPTRLLQARAPSGFQAPPLNWFRGLEADAEIQPEAISAHIEVLMQQQKP